MAYLVNDAIDKIQNDEIVYTIEKGTTEYISLTLKDEKTGNNYVMSSEEKAIFGVKRRLEDSTCVILKQFGADNYYDGKYTLVVSAIETNIPPGRYYFDVGILYDNGDFYKPIKNKQLRINGGVTTSNNII